MIIRGLELHLHDDEDLSNHIRRENDFFEAHILDYICDNHPVQDTIIDIGANIGNHSLYFASFLQFVSIYSFEPIPENFELLKKNMKAPMEKADDQQSIILVKSAISSKTNRSGVFMTANYGNMGNGRMDETGDIEVSSFTLDKFACQDVTLIKIDVEGHEPEVLDGAQDTIFKYHPLILIEDWEREYGKLLPDYEIETAWLADHTFLYRWKE